MNDFVNLHVHSYFSFLDGFNSPNEIVKKAKEMGHKAVALSEHGNMHSYLRLYKAAKKHDIKPIFGIEFYTTDDMTKRKDQQRGHLIALAKNEKGLKNLFELTTASNTKGFYYKPRIDFDKLCEHKEGLIVSSACMAGDVAKKLQDNEYDEAKELALKYKKEFGDDFYLEIMANNMEEQYELNKQIIELSKDIDIPLVATSDVHYLEKEDAEAHDIMLAIQTDAKLEDEDRFKFSGDDYYFKDADEIKTQLVKEKGYKKEIDAAINNTGKIADKCDNIEINLGDLLLPEYEVPEGYTTEEYLEEKAFRKLFELGLEKDIDMCKYADRLSHELEVINMKGYPAYFLIVEDFVQEAKDRGGLVGPGRGSAAGSLLSYLLGITALDPIEHGLLFERFLNPERESMPDIDIDFSEQMRAEMIEYTINKYGRDHVANICNFGTLAAKLAVKDVGRVLGYEWEYLNDEIAKAFPDEQGISLEEALEESEKLQYYKEQHPKLFKIASKLEGKPRQPGTHASAVVITPEPVTNYTPLATSKGEVVTQTEMHDSEDLGMLKMDFLGLNNITLIEDTINFIHERDDLDKFDFVPTIENIWDLPLGDKEVYENIYCEADTNGIFQVSSQLFKRLLDKMQPKEFENIVALVSIGRPGPLDAGIVDDYCDCLHGEKEPEYPHGDLKPVLEESFGSMIYQEQVMKTAQVIADYSLGDADILRRGVGKKIPEVIEKEKPRFIKGAKKLGYSEELAKHLFQLIDYFSGYGFNKCVSKDTVIERASGNQYSPAKLTIEEFYEIWNSKTSTGKKYRGKRGVKILSFDSDGRVRPRKVKNVYKTDVKPVYKITLSDGSNIKATKDHKFFTEEGKWKKLEELSGKDLLLVKGDYEDTQSQDYPVKPTKIENIEYVGEEQTYDLEMESNYEMGHNYIANDIVTHNSHATGYAIISYVTAYLKHYFPAEFYASLMSIEAEKSGEECDIQSYFADCYAREIDILPPDVNESGEKFTAIDGKIKLGLNTIDGIGDKTMQEIIENRPYKGVTDMYKKTNNSVVDSTAFTSLIKSGAFDSVNNNRKELLDKYRTLRKFGSPRQSLFGEKIETTEDDIIQMEIESIGVSISYPSDWDMCKPGDIIEVQGEVVKAKEAKTRKDNKLMCFGKLETKRNEIDLVVFNNAYIPNHDLFQKGFKLKLEGKKGDNNALLLGRNSSIDLIEGDFFEKEKKEVG